MSARLKIITPTPELRVVAKEKKTIHYITFLEEGDVALPNEIRLLEKEDVATDGSGKLESFNLFGRTAEPLDIQGEDP